MQCIEPPIPAGSNLRTDFNGSNPYEFGDNATYTPAAEGLYFEGDRDKTSFQVRARSISYMSKGATFSARNSAFAVN